MYSEGIRDAVARLTDDEIAGVLQAIRNEVKTRTEARNAALPDDVWLIALPGHSTQVAREHARELVEAGTHELVSAPQGDEPTDLCWVATKRGQLVQVSRDRAIELLDAGNHRLATADEYKAVA